jgi:hypothetical protein
LEINGLIHDGKFKIIKDRSDLLRTIKENDLNRENERFGEKVVTK